MQSANQLDQVSYQQIAGKSEASSEIYYLITHHIGIHGRPYVTWNNANPRIGAPKIGYCTHCK